MTAKRLRRPTAQQFEQVLSDLRVSLQLANERLDLALARRKRSVKLAKVLRERGLLLPENEGAAPGSWWVPGGGDAR